MAFQKAFGCIVLVAVLIVPVSAIDLSWEYQIIDQHANQSRAVSLAMRTSSVWPVAFHQGSNDNSNQMVVSALSPVGWTQQGLGDLFDAFEGGLPLAEAGPDGRVGVVWRTGADARFAQSSPSGWQVASLPLAAPSGPDFTVDFDFLSDNRPIVAQAAQEGIVVSVYNGIGWETDQVVREFDEPVQGMKVSTAISSQDEIGVAFVENGLGFAFKSPLSGDWGTTIVDQQIFPESISLAFGPNDETAIASVENDSLYVSRFDPVTGDWATELLAPQIDSNRVNLVYNSLGQPALAYVVQDEVHYRINRGEGWLDFILDDDPQIQVQPHDSSDAALAFDAEDIPVISYYSQDGLLLAYDPIIVPEPASIVLFLMVTVAAVRRQG